MHMLYQSRHDNCMLGHQKSLLTAVNDGTHCKWRNINVERSLCRKRSTIGDLENIKSKDKPVPNNATINDDRK